jgi:hypothetical protein
VAAAVLWALVVAGPAAHAGPDNPGADEATLAARASAERTARRLTGLRVAADLTAVARRHAQDMAASGRLGHSGNLGGEVGGWRKLAENVGTGASADEVHASFMASATHRANILDPAFSEVGVGVAWRDGRIWVAEVFRAPAGAPAPTQPPAPAPPPPPRPAPARASRSIQRAAPPTAPVLPPPGLFAPPPTPPPGLFATTTSSTTTTTTTALTPRRSARASALGPAPRSSAGGLPHPGWLFAAVPAAAWLARRVRRHRPTEPT